MNFYGTCPSIVYECMNLHISLTQQFKVEPKFYSQILHRCVVSSLWAEPINPASTKADFFKGML
jgi:hypothetical protein